MVILVALNNKWGGISFSLRLDRACACGDLNASSKCPGSGQTPGC